MESEVAKAREEAQKTIDDLNKKVEELTAATDYAKMDLTGLKKIITGLTEPLKKLGYKLDLTKLEDK